MYWTGSGQNLAWRACPFTTCLTATWGMLKLCRVTELEANVPGKRWHYWRKAYRQANTSRWMFQTPAFQQCTPNESPSLKCSLPQSTLCFWWRCAPVTFHEQDVYDVVACETDISLKIVIVTQTGWPESSSGTVTSSVGYVSAGIESVSWPGSMFRNLDSSLDSDQRSVPLYLLA